MEKWVEKQYTASAEDIHKIAAVEKNMRIVLEPSVDSNIHITYFESDTETCQIEETPDGTLEIQRQSSKKWYQRIGVMLLFGRGQDRRLEIGNSGWNCVRHTSGKHQRKHYRRESDSKGAFNTIDHKWKNFRGSAENNRRLHTDDNQCTNFMQSLTAEGSLSILTKNGRVV